MTIAAVCPESLKWYAHVCFVIFVFEFVDKNPVVTTVQINKPA